MYLLLTLPQTRRSLPWAAPLPAWLLECAHTTASAARTGDCPPQTSQPASKSAPALVDSDTDEHRGGPGMDMWGLGRTGVFTGAQEALPSVGWSWRGREGGKLRVGAGGWKTPSPPLPLLMQIPKASENPTLEPGLPGRKRQEDRMHTFKLL